LFIRNKAGARLTPAGSQFLRYATTLVQVWERARHQVAMPAGREEVVNIGGEHNLWDPLLSDWLIWMRGAAPDVANSQLTIEGMAAPVPHVPEPEMPASGSIEALPFLEMADVMRAHDGVRAIATHSGITASVPWVLDAESEDFILLEMRVATREPLGAGLWISMSLPMSAPAHLMHALTLNEAELATSSPTDLVGGWLVRNQTLMHESFIPWALCSVPLVRHLAESAARRANWLRQIGPSVLPGEWPEEIRGRVLPFRRMP